MNFWLVVTWQWKKTYIYTSAMPMTIKLDRRSHINFWSSGLVTNVRPYACTCVISMTTKLDKVVTCDGGFEGHLLIMWSRDKRKNIYLNFHDTMATKLGRVVTYGRKISHTMLRDLLITWSRDKYNTLYLHFCSTYEYKIGQSSNSRWGNPTWNEKPNEKNLYLHLHNTYSHQTWHSENLQWGNPTH